MARKRCYCPDESGYSDDQEERDHTGNPFKWTGYEGYLWTNNWLARQRGPFLITMLGATQYEPPEPDEIKGAIGEVDVGRKTDAAVSVHVTAIDTLPELLYHMVGRAADVVGDVEYDVVRIGWDNLVSFLAYTGFMDDPHPSLNRDTTVNLENSVVRDTDYAQRDSPPVLLRKEELLDPRHPRYRKFAALTKEEEKRGLLGEANTMPRRQWEELLVEKGLVVEDHEVRKAALRYRGALYVPIR